MPKTIVSETGKILSAFEKIFSVVEKIISVIEKIFSVTEKIFTTTNTMVKIGRHANLRGINRMATASDHGDRDRKDLLILRKDLFDH